MKIFELLDDVLLNKYHGQSNEEFIRFTNDVREALINVYKFHGIEALKLDAAFDNYIDNKVNP